MKKVGFITLGCDKNRVDGEKILGNFVDNGYEIVSQLNDADVIVVNTCGFIETAKQESLDAIFDVCSIKEETGAKIVVTGCLAERYYEDLLQEIPELDAVIKLQDREKILSFIEENSTNQRGNRILTTPPHYAYLKIADGCNNKCAFCAIPKIRGPYVSYKIEDIVAEAKTLVDNGVKELIIVAQDTTRYGKDIYGDYSLIKLLDELSKLDVEWIRIMYCYPELITDEFLTYVKNNPKICKYLDIPLQHCSDNVLRLMRRRNNKSQCEDLINRIRKIVPELAIRSTFMVGFPGETEEDFCQLEDFLTEYKLDNVGFFTYSREEGTPSHDFKPQISKKIKNERLKRAFIAQQKAIFEKNKKFVGQTIKVLYEGIDDKKQLFVGRGEFQAPEIDGNVFFTADFCPMVGEFYNVKITNVVGYDLEGEITDEYSE